MGSGSTPLQLSAAHWPRGQEHSEEKEGFWAVCAGCALRGLRAAHPPSPLPHPSLPSSTPSLPPFLPCAELRVTSCSETEGFFSSIFKEAAEELARRCRRLPARPAPADANCCSGERLGWAQAVLDPVPSTGQVVSHSWPALCPLGGSSATLRCSLYPGSPAEAEV